MASLTGRIFEHLHRPIPEDNDSDPNGEFWKTHRKIDNILLNMSLYLPAHLRLPAGSSNSNTIFLNMTLQAAIICLHQAAIFKGERLPNSNEVVSESKARCLAAATETASVMKRIAHADLSTVCVPTLCKGKIAMLIEITQLNVYTPFTLYIATRIFAQVSKAHPQDDNSSSSLLFLLSALVALKETNPLVASFLMQLDLEGFGLSAIQDNARIFSGLVQNVVCCRDTRILGNIGLTRT